MNGNKIFIDTNICIYLLNGDTVLSELLQDQNIYISAITEIELYVFHSDASTAKIIDEFIASINVVEIDHLVKQRTIQIRRNSKLKLPDSMIAASARIHNIPFITADRSFKKVADLDLILYEVPNNG